MIRPMCSEFFSPRLCQLAPPFIGAINSIAPTTLRLAVVLARAHPHRGRILRVQYHGSQLSGSFFIEHGESGDCR